MARLNPLPPATAEQAKAAEAIVACYRPALGRLEAALRLNLHGADGAAWLEAYRLLSDGRDPHDHPGIFLGRTRWALLPELPRLGNADVDVAAEGGDPADQREDADDNAEVTLPIALSPCLRGPQKCTTRHVRRCRQRQREARAAGQLAFSGWGEVSA